MPLETPKARLQCSEPSSTTLVRSRVPVSVYARVPEEEAALVVVRQSSAAARWTAESRG